MRLKQDSWFFNCAISHLNSFFLLVCEDEVGVFSSGPFSLTASLSQLPLKRYLSVRYGLTSRSTLWKHTDDNQKHTQIISRTPLTPNGACPLFLQTHVCTHKDMCAHLILSCPRSVFSSLTHMHTYTHTLSMCVLSLSISERLSHTHIHTPFISGTLAGTCRDSPLCSLSACGMGLTN